MQKNSFDPQAALLDWYALHQRDLPWRRAPTPYRVLVSELMLHQTQVDRVVPYFERFLGRFPTIAALADASRAVVIQAWAGLGYNRRAVYLHELARIVHERYQDVIPDSFQALRALPGVGDYTAGAVLSIGFGCDVPALDTNADRVIGRFVFGGAAPRRQVAELARVLLPAGRSRDWNQALMDLGSSLCTASAPRCVLCPLRPGCQGAGLTAPVVRKRETSPFRETTRYFRGRMLAALRKLGAGETAKISDLATSLRVLGVAEPAVGWNAIGNALARDGLATIDRTGGEPAIGLPG